jgi:hypothetical protein
MSNYDKAAEKFISASPTLIGSRSNHCKPHLPVGNAVAVHTKYKRPEPRIGIEFLHANNLKLGSTWVVLISSRREFF